MPAVIDHAEGKPVSYLGAPRNGELPPQDHMLPNGQRMSAPIPPRGMWAIEAKPVYVFKGLNQFFHDAAKRAGFGESSEEASLVAKAPNDWFFKQAAQAISNASVQSDPALIQPSIDRARKLQSVLRAIVDGIEDAIADREPKPSPIVTPEDLSVQPESIKTSDRQPEITHDESSTRHLRSGEPGRKRRDVRELES